MKKKKTQPSLFDQPAEEVEVIQIPPPLPVNVVVEKLEEEKAETVIQRGMARLRDGSVIFEDDEVNMNPGLQGPHSGHESKPFVIEKMTPWETCESGMLIIAALKENKDIKTIGFSGNGIDANWFKKLKI
jgi:hypothetical protein